MKCNIVIFCIKLETYRFCRYRKDSVIIGSVDDICGALIYDSNLEYYIGSDAIYIHSCIIAEIYLKKIYALANNI